MGRRDEVRDGFGEVTNGLEWTREVRSARRCAGVLLALLLLVDWGSGWISLGRAALWCALAGLLFVVLYPARVSADGDWLAPHSPPAPRLRVPGCLCETRRRLCCANGCSAWQAEPAARSAGGGRSQLRQPRGGQALRGCERHTQIQVTRGAEEVGVPGGQLASQTGELAGQVPDILAGHKADLWTAEPLRHSAIEPTSAR